MKLDKLIDFLTEFSDASEEARDVTLQVLTAHRLGRTLDAGLAERVGMEDSESDMLRNLGDFLASDFDLERSRDLAQAFDTIADGLEDGDDEDDEDDEEEAGA